MKTRRLLSRLLLTTALLALIGAAPPHARAADPVELEGSWFVLVHYKDSATANPESDRWLDLVWTFSHKGTRLEWTEYPLVVFEDASGRFEAIAGNPRSRVLARWEPNEGQLSSIMEGPRVNDRGAKVKTLKGSAARGWKSGGRMTTTSAMVVGYQEKLSIDTKDGKPVFVRQDVLGNAHKVSGEGMTRYETTQVLDDGRTLEGLYTRDGHKSGVFRMWRTPPVRGLVEKQGTPNERMEQRAREEWERSREADADAQR